MTSADGMKGVIGVVGPTRMDYAHQATARLSYFAEGLTENVRQGRAPAPRRSSRSWARRSPRTRTRREATRTQKEDATAYEQER